MMTDHCKRRTVNKLYHQDNITIFTTALLSCYFHTKALKTILLNSLCTHHIIYHCLIKQKSWYIFFKVTLSNFVHVSICGHNCKLFHSILDMIKHRDGYQNRVSSISQFWLSSIKSIAILNFCHVNIVGHHWKLFHQIPSQNMCINTKIMLVASSTANM